jgi:fatty-acyl-CoA synthase
MTQKSTAPVDLDALRRTHADQPVPRTMMDRPLSVVDVMRRAESLFADVEVVSRHAPGRLLRSTYGQVGEQARRLAALLQAWGVRPGQRVATLMWNHAAHLSAYYAVPGVGAVLHTLNPRLSAQELAWVVADAGDEILLVDDDLLPLWREVEPHVRVPHVLVHALGELPNEAARAAGQPLWQDSLAGTTPLPDWPDQPVDENAPVSICYTSGTTGRPKGVVYSHRSILLHGLAVATVDALRISGRDTLLTLTPMFHVNAWSMPYTAPLLGARQVLAGPRASSTEIAELMASERVTAALGVPTVWGDVLGEIETRPQTWRFEPGLRIYSGGAAPAPDLFRRFDRLGIYLQTGWGMTETSPIGSQTWLRPTSDEADAEARLHARLSNGLALPFVEMRHVDDQGRLQPRDGRAMGELQVRGPWVTAGYIGHPDPLPATTDDGWLRTGDIVVFEADGTMRLVDRLKDLVKSGGEWISSIDMEKALSEHPGVAEACVIAVPDARWGERPLALLVARPGLTVTPEDVQRYLSEHFPRWMVPDQIAFVPELPRTGTGKLNKARLRQQFTTPSA